MGTKLVLDINDGYFWVADDEMKLAFSDLTITSMNSNWKYSYYNKEGETATTATY